ncbi:MAG TPA: PilZ domain-containing protein [Tepidisphaeraceae bacterium]|jgi:c-di-GMP-binding flagellar brake protein YcgR
MSPAPADEQTIPHDERRTFPRRPARGRASAIRLSLAPRSAEETTIELDLRDISAGGVSAYAQQPVKAGERVTLFFDGAMMQKPFAADGRVVRCDTSHFGYCVAVVFDRTPKV